MFFFFIFDFLADFLLEEICKYLSHPLILCKNWNVARMKYFSTISFSTFDILWRKYFYRRPTTPYTWEPLSPDLKGGFLPDGMGLDPLCGQTDNDS